MKKDEKRGNFDKWLKAYSAAAVGALVLAPAVEAAVVYTNPGAPLAVNPGNPQLVDMDGDGADEAFFWVNNGQSFVSSSSFFSWNFVNFSSFAQNGTGVIFDPTNSVTNLPSNYVIQGPALPGPNNWASGVSTATLTGTLTLNGTYYGPFGNFGGTTGLIGVRFPTACGTAYGWIRFQGISSTSGNVIDWAYEDTCQPIMAGDVGAPAAPAQVPALDKWGALAMVALMSGAAAVAIKRRERKAKA